MLGRPAFSVQSDQSRLRHGRLIGSHGFQINIVSVPNSDPVSDLDPNTRTPSTAIQATTSSIVSARNAKLITPIPQSNRSRVKGKKKAESFTLWCLVEGDSRPFKATALDNADVSDLMKLIKEEGVDIPFAKDLELWKVRDR